MATKTPAIAEHVKKHHDALRVAGADLGARHAAARLCFPVTSDRIKAPLFRLAQVPDAGNGLQRHSQVLVDKPQSVAQTGWTATSRCQKGPTS